MKKLQKYAILYAGLDSRRYLEKFAENYNITLNFHSWGHVDDDWCTCFLTNTQAKQLKSESSDNKTGITISKIKYRPILDRLNYLFLFDKR